MRKVTKKDIMGIPLGQTCQFEMDSPKACLSAKTYAYSLGYAEGFVAKVSINGNRIAITRI